MIDTLLTIPTGLGTIIALVVGYFLKQNPKISNQVIPWVTFAISLLTQIVQNVGPVEAAVLSPIVAIHLSPVEWVLKVILNAALQTLGTTGGVSFVKNGVVGRVSDVAYRAAR